MPEEINRVLTDHVANLLYCPTETARSNLLREGIAGGVFSFGDVMYDSVLQSMEIVDRVSNIVASLDLRPGSYLLATVHRAANTDEEQNLASILRGLGSTDEVVVFPAHPRASQAMERLGLEVSPNVRMLEPVSYLDMLALEKSARLILTDSGGVQKEAYFFGVPCLTLREETEWMETTEAGWNLLVGAQEQRIAEAIRKFHPQGERPPLFGDGKASQRIALHLHSVFAS
jgi:UDP-N-acetylglucosamine 2-epimerase